MDEATTRTQRYEHGRAVLEAVDGTAGVNVIESLREDNYVADSIDAEATDCERE